jgi:hypothetical protein
VIEPQDPNLTYEQVLNIQAYRQWRKDNPKAQLPPEGNATFQNDKIVKIVDKFEHPEIKPEPVWTMPENVQRM